MGIKRIILTAVFLFALSVAFPVVATQSQTNAKAVAATIPAPPMEAVPVPTQEAVAYVLPYPGILPTHPLYMFKKLRDSIVEMLIADPVKKAEFYILQADKKLNMAVFLFASKQDLDAMRQLGEAQTIRAQAVTQLESVVGEGKEIPRFVTEKLSMSVQNHIEVLKGFEQGVDRLNALLDRVKQMLDITTKTKVINN